MTKIRLTSRFARDGSLTEIPQASRFARGDRLTEMKKIVKPYSPENPHKFNGSTSLKKVSSAYTGVFEKKETKSKLK